MSSVLLHGESGGARSPGQPWSGAVLASHVVRPAYALRVADAAAGVRVAEALGLPALPGVNRIIELPAGGLVAWLRPDEWLAIGVVPSPELLAQALGAAGAIVDVSEARVGLTLSGPCAREVLTTCCPLDVHPKVFPRGACAQTLVGRAEVFLAPLGDEQLLVMSRPSLADHVTRWLVDGIASVRLEREMPRP